MCHKSCLEFGKKVLQKKDIEGKSILEVGSFNVNGTLRSLSESLSPASYLGIDLQPGPCVDEICEADRLIERFGSESFDFLISTEMLEHVQNWQKVIHNFKNVIKAQGGLLLTTRSLGFKYHEYPGDYWRFELEDMEEIFSDFIIETLEKDTQAPGVFIKARRPRDFKERSLEDYQVHQVVPGEFSDGGTK